jgi:uncharacterized membrane protein YkoI
MRHNDAMRNKQFIVLGGIATVLAIAGLFSTMSLQTTSAQVTNMTRSNQTMTGGVPQLNGSVNVQQQTNKFIQDNLRVPFATALETARAKVENGTVVSGHVGIIQGYLVYIFKVVNFNGQTSRIVIVDAGNGGVLYMSEDIPFHIGSFGGYGCRGAIGYNGFGKHWDNYDRGAMTSGNTRSSSEASRSGGTAVSPVMGI